MMLKSVAQLRKESTTKWTEMRNHDYRTRQFPISFRWDVVVLPAGHPGSRPGKPMIMSKAAHLRMGNQS